jgi:hypothetical protein
MREHLSEYPRWVAEQTTGRVITGLAAAYLVMQGLFFLYLMPRFEALTGEPLPDTAIAYSYDEMYAAIDSYGAEGIQFYRTVGIVDAVFPLVYGALLTTLLAWVVVEVHAAEELALLVYLPAVAVAFDYVENVGIFVMLWRHPDSYALVATLTSAVTLLKYTGIVLSGLVIVAGGLLWCYRILRAAPVETPTTE